MEFELFKIFRVKAGLTQLCSHGLIAILIEILPELHFGQEVFDGDLQYLHYNLVDMHKLSPEIDKVMQFKR
jgi:hypothetical protein